MPETKINTDGTWQILEVFSFSECSFLALCFTDLKGAGGVGTWRGRRVFYLCFSKLSLWLTKFQHPRDWPVKEDSIDFAFFRAESVPGWKQEMHVSSSLEIFSEAIHRVLSRLEKQIWQVSISYIFTHVTIFSDGLHPSIKYCSLNTCSKKLEVVETIKELNLEVNICSNFSKHVIAHRCSAI